MDQQYKRISVLIVDDHEMVRMGVAMLLQDRERIEVIGTAETFPQAMEYAKRLKPDVVLLDLHLAEGLIVDRIPELLKINGSCKVLALTASAGNDELYLSALKQDVVGILTKCQPIDCMVKAIVCAHSGEMWVTRDLAAALFHDLRNGNIIVPAEQMRDCLTPRQRTIAQMAAQGMPAKRIANTLNISNKTVRNQLVHIYSKLAVSGQVELAIKSSQLGLVE